MMKGQDRTILSLTGMRFVMTMVVVLSHMEFLYASGWNDLYGDYLRNAVPAVDFFFLLSGFGLMLHWDDAQPAGTFRSALQGAVRRIRKIYPLYAVTMVLCIPYSMYSYWSSGETPGQIATAVVRRVVLCVPLLQSCTGIQSYSNAFNGVCWFLSCLFVLYIAFPYLARLGSALCVTLRRTLVSLGVTWALLVAAVLGLSGLEAGARFDNLAYGSPYARVFYFFAGILCARLYGHLAPVLRRGRFWTPLEWLCAAAVAVWFLARNTAALPAYAVYSLDLLLVAALLVVLAFERGGLSAALGSPRMVLLGNASMYIYLLHYPLRLYGDWLVRALAGQAGEGLLLAEAAVLLLVPTAAAVALYRRSRRRP